MNPIFKSDTRTPPFNYDGVKYKDVQVAIDEAVSVTNSIYQEVAEIPDKDRTFENTISPLDDVTNLLVETDGAFCFLAYVSDDEEMRRVAQQADEKLSAFQTLLGFREDIYKSVIAYTKTDDFLQRATSEKRLVSFIQRDYRRNGLDQPIKQQTKIKDLRQRLVAIGIEFRRNIDEHEDYILVPLEELEGLPDNYINSLTKQSTKTGDLFQISLDYPEMYPFMETASSELWRKELFLKNHNKAAEPNIALLEEALEIRLKIAELLGFNSWAEYSIELKMAQTPERAEAFLTDLRSNVQVKAHQDLQILLQEKQSHLKDSNAKLEIWDWRYYQQRVRQEKFSVDQFKVAEYFPLDAVINGMFEIYQKVTGVAFQQIDASQSWHRDVRLYGVTDSTTHEHLAHFYMDLHPRPGKFGHAAAFTLRPSRKQSDGTRQPAISAIVANFTKPTTESPSLLRHSEVETLFHEFGHILHQTLTKAPFSRFSGTAVERDFVEAPSQMLEHWAWDSDVLADFTRHKDTGKPLPQALLDQMTKAKNIGSGIHYLRQIYFASLDLAYHGADSITDTDKLARELHEITSFEFPENTHFQAGFGHLFGYDAGYYGYLWSQVFGDDMFTRFENEDPIDVGRDYRKFILEPGGSKDAKTQIIDFLGREPNNQAFIEEIGLDSNSI
jgi:thimet oligopeptidase|tara:strand:+ start:3528 stop:5534 length:2007 start_codon:yes stop_codon:yes gene_type:complete